MTAGDSSRDGLAAILPREVLPLPAIGQEGAQAGAAWGQQNMADIVKKLQDRLRAEGLIK